MTEFIIEAQKISPAQRHAFIFESFDNLEAEDSIVVVNSHDPVPLLVQLQSQRPDTFTTEYLEEGPTVWRVRITKMKKEGCCGFCGSE